MKNSEIVKILEDISLLLEIKGENIFKARAYQKAARSIEFLTEEVSQMVAENRLKEIPGVGEAISKKITELITTGHLEYYDKLKAEFPEGIGALLDIPGIGPRTAIRLAQELHVKNADELEKAILEGRLARLPRMGDKTARNILHQIQEYRLKKSERRIPLGKALPVADNLLYGLSQKPGLKNLIAAGSLRRFRDTVGDIDILGTSSNAKQAIETFTTLPQIQEVLEKGPTKASAIVTDGIQADLRILDQDSFGSALQYFTGSQQHNIELRRRAERMGLSLSEYGITDLVAGRMEKYSTEEAFYDRQGLDYIPPEIREGQDEIMLAEKGALPHLLELQDIKGDLHCHTSWTDGDANIEEMAQAAIERGYHYLAITDHSVSLGITHGLSPGKIRQQIQEIREINLRYPQIRILTGIEMDIKADGSPDLPDEILAELDIVLASIHSGMNQDEEQMTRRIIRTMKNPYINILCHPTARLLGERPPINVDMEAIFQAAVDYNVAMEINATPSRLDLKDTHISQARQMGIKMVINTDSHRSGQLDFMRLGVGIARRGWCEAKDILNTLPVEKLLQALKK